MQALRARVEKGRGGLGEEKKDSYKILAVSRDCSESTVEKEYRSKHPDKVPVPSCLIQFLQGGDEEKFKLVVEVNTVLSDPWTKMV